MSEKVKVTEWVANLHRFSEAEPGDLIEFNRGRYSHWAVYIGDRQVIHRWGENDGVGKPIGVIGNIKTIFAVNFDKATILQSHISDVLEHGGKVRVNNYRDAIWEL
ncbi:unnamed protein product [Rotaria sp. Silwood2]|nr:unnamed protein product [Rotaria sp. Silwood2]